MLCPIVETQRTLLNPLAMWAAGATNSFVDHYSPFAYVAGARCFAAGDELLYRKNNYSCHCTSSLPLCGPPAAGSRRQSDAPTTGRFFRPLFIARTRVLSLARSLTHNEKSN